MYSGWTNPSVWWHLRVGEWIVRHHSVPATDPFSAYGMGRPWVAYSWLFDLPLYWLNEWLGPAGTADFVLLIVTAIGLALYRAMRARAGGFAAPIGLTAAGVFLISRMYSVRPWLFTVLFFVIEADMLFAELVDGANGQRTRRIWYLPLVFALWANTHIQFVYGLAVLALAAITQNVEVVRTENGVRLAVAGRRDGRLWIIFGLSLLATLANPYSWRLYAVVLEYAREKMPFVLVNELKAPDFRGILDYGLVFLLLAAAFVLGRERFKSNLFVGLLLSGGAAAALRSSRDVWFAVVVALLVIASGLRTHAAAEHRVFLRREHRAAVAVLSVLMIFAWAHKQDLSNSGFNKRLPGVFPVKAADFVLQHRLQGPLYNEMGWGGYLIWRLPELPVSIDDRTNVYGDARVKRNFETWNCLPGWNSDPELASANLVIAPTGQPLTSALKGDPRFRLVYEDERALVFLKR